MRNVKIEHNDLVVLKKKYKIKTGIVLKKLHLEKYFLKKNT